MIITIQVSIFNLFHAYFTLCNVNLTNILQKEEPINNGKVEEKKEEVTTNGNEEDDDDDLDIDDI